MTSKKTQEMTIKTVVVAILILMVLVIVIAFAVPQITTMLGGITELGGSVTDDSEVSTDLNI
ncbi:MAG: hypothetical protein PHT91_02910 [Candidatus Nanoarchaeia archaeon]|nr:hypothetical protein [Candidatus Nanoarchaeia archaeon]MDD5054578.1 hypothetical protein [Candidatus Nanoarchaeia archaeon]MDD5499799.1 hypothetical protein [Candidatus Nanoarchaeia archaeon]